MTESRAYVPGFEHDIFVSYAHVDNLSSERGPGWVDEFHEALRNKLATRVGRIGRLRIWRDPSLDGSQVFGEALKNRIESCAVFLALTSKGYLESDYCLQELRWFHQKAQQSRHGIQIGERRRILNALLTNLRYTDWPREFQGTTGFPLHDAADEDRKDQIGEPTKPETDAFDTQMRKLADATYRLLEDFKEHAEEAPGDVSRKQYIYLADTADSLQEIRDRLKADLTQKGKEILTDIPPPHESKAHAAHVRKALDEASLSMHLLDAYPGRKIPEEPETTYPIKQVQLALASGTSPLIWVPPSLALKDITTEAHRNFLEELENGRRDEKSYDFIREPPERLVQVILEKLERLEIAPTPPDTADAILLETHVKDQKFAFELGSYLLESGLQPFIHQETDDPEAGIRAFEDQLARVKKLVVFFGQVSRRWVESRLEFVLQFVARQVVNAGRSSLDACYVYLLPPEKIEPVSLGPRIFKIEILDDSGSAGFRRETAAPLLTAGAGAGPA
jgi:hypothetical protein